MAEIFRAETRKAIVCCYPVMAELRPHVTEKAFLEKVARQRKSGGFQLAYVEDAGTVRSVAGYRFLENLAWGKFLYVDDLITSETSRSQGYGELLLEWLIQEARRARCDEFHLDSGVQRFGAHRFYLRHGLDITCHHFALKLQ